jgi:hypothetical protein
MKYGPQTTAIEALIARARQLTSEQIESLSVARNAAWGTARNAAWDTARNAAWDTARNAAWDTARNAAWDTARNAAWGAILALVVRDRISETDFNTLYDPWATVMENDA